MKCSNPDSVFTVAAALLLPHPEVAVFSRVAIATVGSAAYATVTVTGYAGIVNLPSVTVTFVSASSVFVTVIVGLAAT